MTLLINVLVIIAIIIPLPANAGKPFTFTGIVTNVDTKTNVITVKSNGGEKVPFQVNENTKFIGSLKALKDVEKEANVTINFTCPMSLNSAGMVVDTGWKNCYAREILLNENGKKQKKHTIADEPVPLQTLSTTPSALPEKKDFLRFVKDGDIMQVKSMLSIDPSLINKANSDNITPLKSASFYGHTDIVNVLIDNGANVDAIDSEGATALMSACQKGHIKIVQLLMSNGSNINIKDNYGWTALMYASQQEGHLDVVNALLDKGVDVNAKDSKGQTTLMLASYNGHADIVKALLKRGVDVNSKHENGMTALIFANNKGHKKIVELLKNAGAKE